MGNNYTLQTKDKQCSFVSFNKKINCSKKSLLVVITIFTSTQKKFKEANF